MLSFVKGKLLDALDVVVIRDASSCRELTVATFTANSNVVIPKYGRGVHKRRFFLFSF